MRKLAAYDNIDGLDASRNMLDVALKQGLYKNGLCQYFDVDSDIQAGLYLNNLVTFQWKSLSLYHKVLPPVFGALTFVDGLIRI